MQKIFRNYISIVMLTAMLAILVINYLLSGKNLLSQQKETFDVKLGQIVQTMENNQTELTALTKSLEEDYLTRAKAFAYLIQNNPQILKSQSELERISILLDVDELHVSDENGIIAYSSVPQYVGLDFHGGKQMQGFLPILESDDPNACVIQEAQPNTAEGRIMQYVGVQRPDQKGIVQIGLKPSRLLEAQHRNTYAYIFSRIPFGEDEAFFAVDEESSLFLGHTDSALENVPLSDCGITVNQLMDCLDGGFLTIDETECYVVARNYGSVLLAASIPKSALYQPRIGHMILLTLYLLIGFYFVIMVLNHLLKIKVVDGIHRILDSLSAIQHGDLGTEVSVDDNPELKTLSSGINGMVDSILSSSVRLSKILESTNLPIAAFECRKDVNRVLVTSRLSELLRFEPGSEDSILSDKQRFLERLMQIRQNPLPKETDVYQIEHSYFIRLQMMEDETGIFGTIQDVTKEIEEKQRIKYEHDHDPLTGLCIYPYFEYQVQEILSRPERSLCAAGIMLDLDHFKQVNDTYGHNFGDYYLKEMAELMSCFPKEHCIKARRSGDEFCLFLFGFETKEPLLKTLDAFWNTLEEQKIGFPDGSFRSISVSGGAAFVQGADLAFETLMYNADLALYEAKRRQKGTYLIYEGGTHYV